MKNYLFLAVISLALFYCKKTPYDDDSIFDVSIGSSVLPYIQVSTEEPIPERA
jgi:hypothetical protein